MPSVQKTSFNENETHFVYIGRLDAYHKGLDLMLEAVRIKADFLKANRCRFDIYGPDYKGRYAHLQEIISEKSIDDLVLTYASSNELLKKIAQKQDVNEEYIFDILDRWAEDRKVKHKKK